MSIPKLTEDLKIIQKLSDLPNSTEGLTAAELKAKFDYAPLSIQKFINEQLVPNIVSDQIPFSATNEIRASNIYDAILNVQSQVRDAAAGVLVNGSVTAEKLSKDLMERVYGGRPWVCVDTPDSANNVAAGFPVGQLWLRPRFTVKNEATAAWTATACKVTTSGRDLTITGTKTVATATALQTLSNLGVAGDRVFILFDVANKDSEITSMTVSFNGAAAQNAVNGGVFEVNLTGTSMTTQFNVTWPSTSLADGSVTVKNYSVVNVSKILRQMSEVKDMENWSSYLKALQPIGTHTSAAEVFIQTSNGQWWPFGFETLAVSRGGTGLTAVNSGALLVGTGNAALRSLAPGTSGAMLQMANGQPVWTVLDYTAIVSGLGFLRCMEGDYQGTGARTTVTLPLAPKLLRIYGPNGTGIGDDGFQQDQFIRDGETVSATVYTWKEVNNQTVYSAHTAHIKLAGKVLTFYSNDKDSYGRELAGKYMNASGQIYKWFALY